MVPARLRYWLNLVRFSQEVECQGFECFPHWWINLDDERMIPPSPLSSTLPTQFFWAETIMWNNVVVHTGRWEVGGAQSHYCAVDILRRVPLRKLLSRVVNPTTSLPPATFIRPTLQFLIRSQNETGNRVYEKLQIISGVIFSPLTLYYLRKIDWLFIYECDFPLFLLSCDSLSRAWAL
jgi:hypothetical protein